MNWMSCAVALAALLLAGCGGQDSGDKEQAVVAAECGVEVRVQQTVYTEVGRSTQPATREQQR